MFPTFFVKKKLLGIHRPSFSRSPVAPLDKRLLWEQHLRSITQSRSCKRDLKFKGAIFLLLGKVPTATVHGCWTKNSGVFPPKSSIINIGLFHFKPSILGVFPLFFGNILHAIGGGRWSHKFAGPWLCEILGMKCYTQLYPLGSNYLLRMVTRILCVSEVMKDTLIIIWEYYGMPRV